MTARNARAVDQFDLSDAALSLAISLLAITALSQKRWLFVVAMIPTAFGVVMGLSGLFGWNLHPDALIKPLTQHVQPATWQLAEREFINKSGAAGTFS